MLVNPVPNAMDLFHSQKRKEAGAQTPRPTWKEGNRVAANDAGEEGNRAVGRPGCDGGNHAGDGGAVAEIRTLGQVHRIRLRASGGVTLPDQGR